MTNTSNTDHYDAAEKLLEEAESYCEPDTRAQWCLELAKMHLALSQASTAARALDRREKATGEVTPCPPAGRDPASTATRSAPGDRVTLGRASGAAARPGSPGTAWPAW